MEVFLLPPRQPLHMPCLAASPALPLLCCLAPCLVGNVPGREGTESPVFVHEEQPLCPDTQQTGSRPSRASMPTIPVTSVMPCMPLGQAFSQGPPAPSEGRRHSPCKDPLAAGSLPSGQAKQREARAGGLTLPAHLLCTARHRPASLSTFYK